MSETELRVQAYIATGNDADLDALVDAITSTSTTLLDVVKALGTFLTSEDDSLRGKGVTLLASIVGRLPPAQMNRHATRTMLAFFTQKLEDTETIIPALNGILKLTALPTFLASDVEPTCTSLFTHVKMKAHVQSTRFIVYSIIDAFIAMHRDVLKNMGDKFLAGYINLADGEKDPRNLILSFAMLRVILVEFGIERHVDNLFDITFCYFPITFTPPPDDPYAISADDLKSSLRMCLSGTSRFGPLAIPLFLEKLTAGSPATKRETMNTLSVCLPVYGARLAQDVGKQVWDTLKVEIFQPIDNETQSLALKATQALVRTIYSQDAADAAVSGTARTVTDECLRILREPEKNQAKPATLALSALIDTTLPVGRAVISASITHLMGLFLNPDEAPNRPAVLGSLASLCTTVRKFYSDDSSRSYAEEKLLEAFKDQLLGAFTIELKNPESTAAALDGLQQMVLVPGLLSDEELGFVVHNLNDILLSVNVEGETRTAMLDLFLSTAKIAPKHVEETTLPLLFGHLPDRAPADDAARTKAARALATLRTLCVAPVLFETLVVRLLVRLELAEDALYALAILSTLEVVLEAKIDAGHADVPKYVDGLVPRLYALSAAQGRVRWTSRMLETAAAIVTLVVRTLTAERQRTLLAAVWDAFIHGNGRGLVLSTGLQNPFDIGSNAESRDLVIMFFAAVVPLRAEVLLPTDDLPEFLETLILWTIERDANDNQRLAVCRAIASVINKHVEGLLKIRLPILWQRFVTDSSSQDSRKRTIEAWTWITKAPIVRNHEQAMVNVELLFGLFPDPDVGWDASKALGNVGGQPDVLNKKNHAVIRILHAQRFFNAILPRILTGAKSASDPSHRTAYLVALTSMIKTMPQVVYKSEMPQLMPMLIRGLDLPDSNLRLNVIETLLSAARDESSDPGILSERATTLAETMLKIAASGSVSEAPVRLAALRYLGTLPGIVRYEVLHPLKARVIRELGKLLDDSKRSIRKDAVDAREKWYLYTA
ncbi:ARM repeat-containing protein [Auricularia subglabra TFB-10046 SS5]|nr:ARM repeat-containing protein [Auricularia subglabra TFB-10046 SS5]